jgi:hypothetical protein
MIMTLATSPVNAVKSKRGCSIICCLYRAKKSIISDEVLFSEPGMPEKSSPFWALSIYRMSQLAK